MIDHDRLFKELLSTFFLDFLELFFPDVMEYLEPTSITFLDKEVFTDVTEGDRYETDLLVQAQFKKQPSFFLIHIENQSTPQASFGQRMFRYFSRLHEKYGYPVYPVVIFSYDRPKIPAPNQYTIEFPEFSVLQFNYRVIQLNRLHWRDFLDHPNPVATALMAKMNIAIEDRPKAKAQCLRLLVTLKLDPARMQLISGFVDTYLKLTPEEETAFTMEIGDILPEEQEQVMEIVTSWMERGIEQGLERGLKQGLEQGRQEVAEREATIFLQLLEQRLGLEMPNFIVDEIRQLSLEQIEAFGRRVLGYEAIADVLTWLYSLDSVDQQKARCIRLLSSQLDPLPPSITNQIQLIPEDGWSEARTQISLAQLGFTSIEELDCFLAQIFLSSDESAPK